MRRSTFGMLAAVLGSALAGWWWSRERLRRADRLSARKRGEVIFDNTPTAQH